MTALGAQRVGRLVPNLAPGYRVCWRCGAHYKWQNMKLVEGAPCLDCRDVLRDEGDTTNWTTQSRKPRPSKETTAA